VLELVAWRVLFSPIFFSPPGWRARRARGPCLERGEWSSAILPDTAISGVSKRRGDDTEKGAFPGHQVAFLRFRERPGPIALLEQAARCGE